MSVSPDQVLEYAKEVDSISKIIGLRKPPFFIKSAWGIWSDYFFVRPLKKMILRDQWKKVLIGGRSLHKECKDFSYLNHLARKMADKLDIKFYPFDYGPINILSFNSFYSIIAYGDTFKQDFLKEASSVFTATKDILGTYESEIEKLRNL